MHRRVIPGVVRSPAASPRHKQGRITRGLKIVFRSFRYIIAIALALYFLLCLMYKRLYDDQHAPVRLRVATVTLQVDADPAINRQKFVASVRTIKREHPETELIMFGEASLGRYHSQSLRDIAESTTGETVRLMSQTAREFGIFLCFGIPEKAADGAVYLSQMLISPDGSILAIHRKFYNEGSKVFQLGTVPATMVDIRGIRTALIICSDVKHPAVRKTLAKERPELILAALASPKDPDFVVSGVFAKVFDAWIVTANRYGDEGRLSFDGATVIGDPLGRLRATGTGKEQYLYFDIGIDHDQTTLTRWLRKYYNSISLLFFVLWHVRSLFVVSG